MTGASIDLDILKDIPGYKGILKAVLRYQIQQLVEQLCEHGGEESVVLSANVTEGTLSHLGTEAGKGFLTDNNDVKRQYLGYCLKNYQKRKSEFMSPPLSAEDIQPSKYAFSRLDNPVGYQVHKKPYFRAQRRNTRLRSGGKQFSTFYSKTGVNRPVLQKLATQGAYRDIAENVSQSHGDLTGQLDSAKSHEVFVPLYKGQRLYDQGHMSMIPMKFENQTDEGNSKEGTVISQNESKVHGTVKVEPSEEVDETGNINSTKGSEDIQTLEGGRLSHHFSPNASMDTEDSVSEGNQSFEYVLDQENSESFMSPWKQDDTEKVAQFTSKRKQALPTRIKKHGEQTKDKTEFSGPVSQSKGSAWTQEQMLNLPPDNTLYAEGGADMSWADDGYQTGGMKSYMKTPQIDGLFVSRGEGRYEKLIKCEDCGKVCRTSNMARHKKRYCTTSPSGGRTRKNYAQTSKDASDNYGVYPENRGACSKQKFRDMKDEAVTKYEYSRSKVPKEIDSLDGRNSDGDESNSLNNTEEFEGTEENVNIIVKQEPESQDDVL